MSDATGRSFGGSTFFFGNFPFASQQVGSWAILRLLMQEQQSGAIPPSKRRVRSGCLTCRKRRRKCDEGKPTCQNCRTRNLQCQYGLNITFVESRQYGSAKGPQLSTGDFTTQYQPDSRGQTFPAVWNSQRRGASKRTPACNRRHKPAIESTPDQTEDLSQFADIEHEIALSTKQTPLLNEFDPFGSVSTLPRLSSHLADHSWDSISDTPLARLDTANGVIEADDNEQRTIDLFTFFRYHIAPRLDLGVGDPFYGVCVLVRAKACDALHHSILAMSSFQNGSTPGSFRELEDATSDEHASRAMASLSGAEQEDRMTVLILLALRDVTRNHPGLWSDITLTLQRNTNNLTSALHEGQWQVMARLVLASKLNSPVSETRLDLSFISECARTVFPGQILTNKQQLRQALSSLGRALMSPRNDAERLPRTSLPLAAIWQSCWSDTELWYFARNEEMQQVFEVDDTDMVSMRSPASALFPSIVFSNVCALLANFCNHLTALYLLHYKPRLTKPVAQPGWSTSPVWHAQRLVGMVATFNEAEIFDPLVVAGLIYVSRKLSHPSQLAVVAAILKKAAQTTGMQLQGEVAKIEAVCEKTPG